MLYFISDFAEHGNDVFISRVLSECVNDGLLLRIANGIYCKPIETRFGPLFPSVEEIVKAIARRDNAQILPTGETAQNQLGLSTQVPANAVFYTTGSTRRVPIGEGKGIQFLHTSSAKKFAFNSRLMMLIVSAMRDIGKDQLSEEQTSVIKKHLENVPNEDFNHDIQLAPMWVRKILLSL